MKKVIILLTIIVSFGAANAQTDSIKAQYSVITFEKYSHNFDTLEHLGNGTYAFKFTNTGSDTLLITNARGSCGCTVPTYPKNKAILPGEFDYIKVTYDTKRKGFFSKTVTVISNSKVPQETLTIKGYVRPKPTVVDFPVGMPRNNGMTPFEN